MTMAVCDITWSTCDYAVCDITRSTCDYGGFLYNIEYV